MSGQCENYQIGRFVVQGTHWFHRHRFLVQNSTAGLLTSFLGVAITLAGTRLWVLYSALLKLYFDRLLKKRKKDARAESLPVLLDVLEPVGGVPPGNPFRVKRVQQIEDLVHLNEHSHSDIGMSLRLFKDVLHDWRMLTREEALLKLGLAILLLVLFMAVTLGGIFSAYVVLDSNALCKSSKCGLWYPLDADLPGNPYWEATIVKLKLLNQRQTGAAAHVERCYRGSRSVEGCDNLFTKSIDYKTSMTKCPLDGDVCLQEDLAFTLDTGWQDSRVLGIDSPRKQSFRRRATCAPVVANMTYIKQHEYSSGKTTVRYYYGPYSFRSYTFETPINDFVEGPGIGTYMVDVVTNSDPEDFQLITPFRSQQGPVSLIQIFPYNLLYPQPSDDPVFYTNKKVCLKDKPMACSWTRAPSIASMLACVDINEYCVDGLRQCFRPGHSSNRSLRLPKYSSETNAEAALLLLGVAMGAATIIDAFSIRLAQALEVQSLVAQQQMTSVQNGKWKSEVENLFQLSLAMLQNRVVDIANGYFHDQPYVVNLFEEEVSEPVDWSAMCDQVLVQAPGFQSVSLLAVLSILVMVLFTTVISINPEGKFIVFDFVGPFFKQLWYISKLVFGTASALFWKLLKASWNFAVERLKRAGILLWEKRELGGRWLLRQVKALADLAILAITNLLSLPIRLAAFVARRSAIDGRIRLESA